MIEDLPSGSDITLCVKWLLHAADAGDRLPTPRERHRRGRRPDPNRRHCPVAFDD